MKLKLLTISLLLSLSPAINAQSIEMEVKILRNENEQLRKQVKDLKAQMESMTFALLSPWDNLIEEAPEPDSYIAILQKIDPSIMVEYTDVMKKYIDYFCVAQRKLSATLTLKYMQYLPYFEEVFNEYEIPVDITALAIIESGLDPRAKSKAGARGMWQIMEETGKIFGLTINFVEDQRYDYQLSTVAAAKILRDSYRKFGSWPLAICAYNCGNLNVQNAIQKAGTDSFWPVWDYLPKETQAYLPSLIGILCYIKSLNKQES